MPGISTYHVDLAEAASRTHSLQDKTTVAQAAGERKRAIKAEAAAELEVTQFILMLHLNSGPCKHSTKIIKPWQHSILPPWYWQHQ